MRGNTLDYFGAGILILIPVIIGAVIFVVIYVVLLASGFSGMPIGRPHATFDVLVVYEGVKTVIGFVITAAGITVLSKFYCHIIGVESGESGAAGLA